MRQLLTSRTLDRESVSDYTVVLVCHDLGRPSLSTTVLVDVVVTDVNDNAPTFLSDVDVNVDVDVNSVDVTYVAELFENNFVGAFVAQVIYGPHNLTL